LGDSVNLHDPKSLSKAPQLCNWRIESEFFVVHLAQHQQICKYVNEYTGYSALSDVLAFHFFVVMWQASKYLSNR
jgi:hypothetical protein